MSAPSTRGTTLYCPVCGAEVTVIASQFGEFEPRCCNVRMREKPERAVFYVCPVCGAEVAIVRFGGGEFAPRCCNTDMQLAA